MADLFSDLVGFLSPRQRTSATPTDDGLTIIAVTTMTAPQTFDGDAILVTETPTAFAGGAIAGGAVFASRTSSAAESALETAPAVDSNTVIAPVATSASIVPTSNTIINNGAFGVSSGAASASATSAESGSSSGGLSGGAKAGIAFGVLIPLAALLIGALILIKRKKQQQKNAGERLDDEKTAMANTMPPSSFGSAPASGPAPMAHAPVLPQVTVRSSPGSLTAPRLSLRPQSQFNSLGGSASGNGAAMAAGAGALGAGAAVGAAAIAAKRSPSPQQSAWERPGNEKNANDPANPFGNHAETVAMHNTAPAPQPRAPSPMNIDASDFPLPGSVAPSEKAISLAPMSTDNLSMMPPNPAAASTVSLATPSTPASSVGMAAAAAGAAGAAGVAAGAAAAGASPNSPPAIVDNVYRVQLDFKPSMEDELDIRAGQLVRMLHSYDDGWALCMRMDRSQQGVVPRTCLSKNTVKPRQGPPPNQQRGPGPRGPNSPAMRGPPPPGMQGRPMPPTGRHSPAPGFNGPPPQGRPMTPTGGRNSPAPGQQRARAMSNASMGGPAPGPAPYAAYNPQVRSQSPGPYGAPGGMMPPPSRPDAASRTRSNSVGNAPPQLAPLKPLSPTSLSATPASAGGVARKPVPGMAV